MPIHQSLTYIKGKVEKALKEAFPELNIDVHLDSIAKDDVIKEGVYVSLLYEEEEKTLKNNDYLQTYYEPNDPSKIKGYRKVNPSIFLNLYVLILSTHTPYEEGLKQISSIISYFRRNNVFSKQRKENGHEINDFADVPKSKLHKLILNLYTLTFEQNNSLWQTLGSKLYPYVVYKVTMAAYVEEPTEPNMEPVKKVLEVIKPMMRTGAVEGSDPAITDAAVIEAEKAQNEQEAETSVKELLDEGEPVLGEGDEPLVVKSGKSVIIVNSKEVYEAIINELVRLGRKEKP